MRDTKIKKTFEVLVYGHVYIIIIVIFRSQKKNTDLLCFKPDCVALNKFYWVQIEHNDHYIQLLQSLICFLITVL